NFREKSMVKQYAGANGAQGENYKLYYDGNSYQEASQVNKDQPKPGDTTVTFKEPQPNGPKSATYHQDGRVTTLRADNTIVEQDQNGFVTAVNGPRGNYQFNRDVNGDVMQYMRSYQGADGN